jgi:hypothetical protein
MSGAILASQEVSSKTEIFTSSVHFGRPCGLYWGATSSFILHSILKQMAEQRLSTKSWCMLSELTLGIENNGTINYTFSNIATTRQHILLQAFHLFKYAWASNQHLQLSLHSLGLLKVPSINNKNNCQLNNFSNKLHNTAVQSHQHSNQPNIMIRNAMTNKEPSWPFNQGIKSGYTWIRNASKVTIRRFYQSDMVCIQYSTRLEKMHIGWICHHN